MCAEQMQHRSHSKPNVRLFLIFEILPTHTLRKHTHDFRAHVESFISASIEIGLRHLSSIGSRHVLTRPSLTTLHTHFRSLFSYTFLGGVNANDSKFFTLKARWITSSYLVACFWEPLFILVLMYTHESLNARLVLLIQESRYKIVSVYISI